MPPQNPPSTSHSVESHLSVDPAEYDAAIRAFVPAYDEMLATATRALGALTRPDAFVVDLGAGTGALSQSILRALPDVRVHVIDLDPAMLERARGRLDPFGARVTFERASFSDALPPCDAFVASLSLHHVRELEQKRALYKHLHASLRPGGVVVNADAAVHADPRFASLTRRMWAEHLARHGDTLEQAYARFDEWAAEDTYFGVEEELAALRDAGFRAVDVVWRAWPTTVLIAARD